MRRMRWVAFTIAVALGPSAAQSQPLTTAGQPARLEISQECLRGAGSWIRMSWNDRAGQLTLEPGAPPGATNLVAARTFTCECDWRG